MIRLATLFLLAVLILPALLSPSPARAHPHAWIDLEVDILFNEDGKAIGLRQLWRFDELYTVFATEGRIDRDGDGKPDGEALDELTEANLLSLGEYSWFTKAEADGAVLKLSLGEKRDSSVVNDQLEMRFTVLFEAPIDPATAALQYKIFDPTFYIEMLHTEGAAIGVEGAPSGCKAAIVPPDPSQQVVGFAASLDTTESGGDGLGEHFAETVRLRCAEG